MGLTNYYLYVIENTFEILSQNFDLHIGEQHIKITDFKKSFLCSYTPFSRGIGVILAFSMPKNGLNKLLSLHN